MRLSVASCSLLALMWSHTLEVTCARVIGPLPTTPSSAGESVTGLFSALFLAAIKSILSSVYLTPRLLPVVVSPLWIVFIAADIGRGQDRSSNEIGRAHV